MAKKRVDPFVTMKTQVMSVTDAIKQCGLNELAEEYRTRLNQIQDSQSLPEHVVATYFLYNLKNDLIERINDSGYPDHQQLKDLTALLPYESSLAITLL